MRPQLLVEVFLLELTGGWLTEPLVVAHGVLELIEEEEGEREDELGPPSSWDEILEDGELRINSPDAGCEVAFDTDTGRTSIQFILTVI